MAVFRCLGLQTCLMLQRTSQRKFCWDYPQPMEQIGQNHGYILYRSDIKNQYHEERLKALETP